MEQVPVGVGNAEAQARFLERHRRFLEHHPRLHRVMERTFIRSLKNPSEDEVDRVLTLDEADPERIAFEDRVMADRAVFYFGRVTADDFGELLILCGNAKGIGAYKILRGMYERTVTASFIAKNVAEVRHLIDDIAIKKWKLWTNLLEVSPEAQRDVPDARVADLKAEYDRVRAARREVICTKCGQPKTQEAWTRVDLATMAKKAAPQLAALYGSCYLEPTFHSHATAFGLERRIYDAGSNGYSYRETSEDEAGIALVLGHNVLLQMLQLQDDYFQLGLDEELSALGAEFLRIWRREDSPEPSA